MARLGPPSSVVYNPRVGSAIERGASAIEPLRPQLGHVLRRSIQELIGFP